MADLRTNYKDDVLDASVNDKRKYQMIQNSDGTVSFNDVTTYTQNGDSYGSNDVNETNEAVNALNNSLQWKHLIQINNALGKVISYPTDDWNELKIFATVNGGTNCNLDVTIIKDILTDKKQFISDCIYVNSTTYDTIIFSFSKSNFSVHSVTINGQSGDCGINIFYK